MPTKQTGGKVGRSSKTGRFVPVEYAKKHPSTTEIEKIKRSPSGRMSGKSK